MYSGYNKLTLGTGNSSYDIALTGGGRLDVSNISQIYKYSGTMELYNYGGNIDITTRSILSYGINISAGGRLTLGASSYSSGYGIKLDCSYIGFFGSTPASKTTITNLTSSATSEQVRSKLIDLIGILKNYGLV